MKSDDMKKPRELLAELGVKPGANCMDFAVLELIKEVRKLKARVAELERPRTTRAKKLLGRLTGALASET